MAAPSAYAPLEPTTLPLVAACDDAGLIVLALLLADDLSLAARCGSAETIAIAGELFTAKRARVMRRIGRRCARPLETGPRESRQKSGFVGVIDSDAVWLCRHSQSSDLVGHRHLGTQAILRGRR